jgi:DNA-binding beta-propeller fold protein YncE
MKKRHLLLFLFLIMVTFSCAPPPVEKKTYNIVWPLPPEEPRIRFIDIIRNSKDIIEKKAGVLEALFGEEGIQAFSRPYGIATDKEGKIYVTDIGRVWVIDFEARSISFIGTDPGVGRLKNPVGVATSSDGRVFVADTFIDKVYVYKDKKLVGAIGMEGEFIGAGSVAVDEKGGLLYIADSKKHLINVYSLQNYKKLKTIGSRGSGKGEFNYPTFITTDKEGRLYVVDTGNFRVQIFDREGNFIKTFGMPGDTPGSFVRPKGIAIDSDGHIYVVDTAFQNFQIFDFEGNILLAVGKGGTEPGQFLLPAGIAIDARDRIYVVNQMPPFVQVFQYIKRE